MIEHRDGHGVDGVPDGDALPLDEVKGHPGVEGVHDDQAGTVGEGRERDAETAPGPRHGQGVEHAVRLGDAKGFARVPAVRHGIPVADHRALGERRRPRRVENGPRIVGGGGRPRFLESLRPLGFLPSLEHLVETQTAGVGILRVHDDTPELREAGQGEIPRLAVAKPGQHVTQDLEEVDGPGDDPPGRGWSSRTGRGCRTARAPCSAC